LPSQDGGIAEIGSHVELLSKENGLYASMWQLQQQEREIGEGGIVGEGKGPAEDSIDK